MFKINNFCDETIGLEYFPESVESCASIVENIGCLLYYEAIEDFPNNFSINMVLPYVGLYWIIKSNQKTNCDFVKQCPSWVRSGPWYTSMDVV